VLPGPVAALTAAGPPISVVPEKKLTVPVGEFPVALLDIVAVSTTFDPAFTVFALDVTAIVVAAFVIVRALAVELPALKLASPL
jgi:hypothetical protein